MTTTIRPLGKNILVRPTKARDMTPGGIVLPENARAKPQTGEILAVGHKVSNVTVRNTIAFPSFVGSVVEVNGEELIVMKSKDVLGVIL